MNDQSLEEDYDSASVWSYWAIKVSLLIIYVNLLIPKEIPCIEIAGWIIIKHRKWQSMECLLLDLFQCLSNQNLRLRSKQGINLWTCCAFTSSRVTSKPVSG